MEAQGRKGPAKGRSREKRRLRTQEAVSYIVAVRTWDWEFSFGINNAPKLDPDPYSDYRHLQITGIVISPSQYQGKRAELHFLPSRSLNEENRQQNKPVGVGSLTSEKDRFYGVFSIPQDSLTDLLQMLASDRYRWVFLNGQPLRYRTTSVRSFRFQSKLEEEDFPVDL